jgi:hypothetical protein
MATSRLPRFLPPLPVPRPYLKAGPGRVLIHANAAVKALFCRRPRIDVSAGTSDAAPRLLPSVTILPTLTLPLSRTTG